MSHVFGPVPSRRLGRSLGVDPIPLKTCNWNCVYCQLGRTRPVTLSRRAYVPLALLLDEVEAGLAAHEDAIDYITIVGSGEPTLHSELAELVQGIKARTAVPLAVISNGALLYEPRVREALLPADAVLPSLDAGSADLYRMINRPHPAASFERLVEGLIAFRQVYTGHYWLEVMLLRALNDSDEALHEIAAVAEQVQPDQIHIGLPTRPPAESWVEPANDEGIMRAQAILGRVATVLHPAGVPLAFDGCPDLATAVLDIIGRHPLPESQLTAALDAACPGASAPLLAELLERGAAQVVRRHSVRFWCAGDAYFPPEGPRQSSRRRQN